MLVTERPGRMRIVTADGMLSEPLAGLPAIRSVGAEGLHDVVLDPHFDANRFIYFTYFAPPPGAAPGPIPISDYGPWVRQPPAARNAQPIGLERVACARLSDDEKSLQDVTVIDAAGNRRLVFARDGTLLVTTGTPGGPGVPIDDEPQRLTAFFGKVLRINADGSIPKDNPWLHTQGARADIYARGLRDAEGAAINPSTGELWTVEHGPKGGDELNIVRARRNYGYPVITYGRMYSGEPIGHGLTAKRGMDQPVYFWVPSIAPSGLLFYTGDLFREWQGNLFVGALAGKHLVRLVFDGKRVVAEESLLAELGKRIRDVRQAPDGSLIVLTDEDAGAILRIRPGRD
jgi:aldose sugar dehydrogenase